MWFLVLIFAEVFAFVWLAAIILAARDRLRGHVPSAQIVTIEEAISSKTRLPRWKRLAWGPFIIIIVLPVSIVLLVLFLPIAVWMGLVHGFYWSRYQLFGIPMPRPDPPVAE